MSAHLTDARTTAAADRLRRAIWAEWWDDAACRGRPTEWWIPDETTYPDPRAVRLCRRCDVREDCHSHAVAHHERGIWGGATEWERRAARSNRG